MRGTRARAFASVFLWALGARAQTAPPSTPEVRASQCPQELADALPGVIKLEIDVLLRERGPTRAPPERVAIRCEGDSARIEVTLQGEVRESSLELAALAREHRARALALAVAELVHSLASRPSAARPPEKMPDQSPTPVASPPPAFEPKVRLSARPALLVGGLAEWLGNPKTPVLGARLALYYPLGTIVAPALSLDGALGSFHAPSARVTARTLTAATHLYFGMGRGKLRWDAGPGVRFGWVRLAGHPDAGSALEGQSLTAAWGGPEVRTRLMHGEAELRSPRFALELGAGLVALPVHGLLDGAARVYTLEGPWWSVCAQVGLGL